MVKLTKNRKLAVGKIEEGRLYKLSEAASLLKEVSTTRFDASVDIDVKLGVDPRKANQMVRGVVTLPHGTGKETRVLVLCTRRTGKRKPDRQVRITWDLKSISTRYRRDGPMWM
jgi:large subunit ribosomal protein L1